MSAQNEKTPAENKYARLPKQIRPEDMIATQESRPQPYEKGEYDRETEFMLRTTGLFI
jgi:hypothetical protein